MFEFLSSEPVWLLVIYGILFVFAAFFPLAFIYSMLFAWMHQSKKAKEIASKGAKSCRYGWRRQHPYTFTTDQHGNHF